MHRSRGEVMWPRLVASKILGKRLVGNNFVADFPNQTDSSLLQIPPFNPTNCAGIVDEETRNFKVFVSTWNVGGVDPSEDFHIHELIQSSNACDIYVFGFQEVVPLRAVNVLGSEKRKISTKWNSMIRKALRAKENNSTFRCIISKQMVGIFITVWVRAEILPFVRSPSVSCVGCGIMGCLGNKGSVSVRFRLHETSFCFVSSHLASGGKDGDHRYRNSNVADILSRTIFPAGPSLDLPTNILGHDRVIFLGDLNYRSSLPESATRVLVKKGDWTTLLEHDQLKVELKEGGVFDGWYEGVINFPPTYKYYPASDEYYGEVEVKEGGKKRAPAWCDRIIWHGEGLKQHSYERGESRLSDHRPVKAIFCTQVRVKAHRQMFLSDRLQIYSLRVCHGFSLPVEKEIWAKDLPTKISLCSWKAWFDCLPTDDNIARRGVLLASSCECCVQRVQESLDHILATSQLAAELWNRAATATGISFSNPQTWRARVLQWQMISRRCKARFEGVFQPADHIWLEVRSLLGTITYSANLSFSMQILDNNLINSLGIRVRWKQKPSAQRVFWTKPPPGWLKVNTDGSCRNNPGPSGGGGIVRDSHGNCIFAYSVHFGIGTNNSAELQDATEGIRICKAAGWHNIILETDSALLIGWITRNACNPWYIWDFWESFQEARAGLRVLARHQFREGNGIADHLAKLGADGFIGSYTSAEQLPRQAKGMLRLDKWGLPNIRIR